MATVGLSSAQETQADEWYRSKGSNEDLPVGPAGSCPESVSHCCQYILPSEVYPSTADLHLLLSSFIVAKNTAVS